MYWLYVDAGEWQLCEKGRLETARKLGYSASVMAEQVMNQLKRLFPDLDIVLFEDE